MMHKVKLSNGQTLLVEEACISTRPELRIASMDETTGSVAYYICALGPDGVRVMTNSDGAVDDLCWDLVPDGDTRPATENKAVDAQPNSSDRYAVGITAIKWGRKGTVELEQTICFVEAVSEYEAEGKARAIARRAYPTKDGWNHNTICVAVGDQAVDPKADVLTTKRQ